MSAIALNEAQQDAVVSDEPLLAVACPGSGKTRVLIEKARHTLATRPEAKLVLTTFSRDAAQEIRDRVKASLGAVAPGRLVVGTFHALAMGQLRRANAFHKVLGEIETEHLIRRALAETQVKIPIDEADERIARCKTDPAAAKADPEAAVLAVAYQKLLVSQDACDFTDLLVRCVSGMDDGSIVPLVATHIYCDEFQDIDRIQFEWLRRHLATGAIPCAVGDDDQSVFGFRRALGYKGMMEFVELTGARIVTLAVNYRSTAGILAPAGRLIAQNFDRVPKALRAARGDGPRPQVRVFDDPAEQGMMLVTALDAICRDNPRPPPAPENVPWRFAVREGQAAVLARTNQHLSDLEPILIRERIPYSRTGKGIWKTVEAQTLVSLLSALDEGRGVGLEVALRWAGVPDAARQALLAATDGSLWNVLDGRAPSEALPGGATVATFLERVRQWRLDLAAGQTREVVAAAGNWLIETVRRAAGDERAVRRLVGLRDLLADVFQGSLAARIAATRRESKDDTPRVVLATFHAAKGLEWDHVFLTDIVQGVVPNIGDSAEDAALEEERRVFYVAMTRARDSLTLFTSPTRGASEFLRDAGLVVAP